MSFRWTDPDSGSHVAVGAEKARELYTELAGYLAAQPAPRKPTVGNESHGGDIGLMKRPVTRRKKR